ncbi:MAG: hypothetical protein E6I69_00915 [Chloroflexi bacterium]|nr:MAG: hypothetical protein E6I69_00915 [Chloroflexota bacterium]
MRKWFSLRSLVAAGGFAGATAAALFAGPAASIPALADTTGCPSTSGKATSNLVGSSFAGTTTVTYYFSSLVDQSPSSGVPGLIRYCVYPGVAPDVDSVVVAAMGDNGASWQDPAQPPQFSFDRPDGNPSNIGLDGRLSYVMGTATWAAGAPSDQTILLHINDPAECASLYATNGDPDAGTAGTCWVFPGSLAHPAADLTASKDANPSFVRSFTWGVTKSVDATSQNIALGSTAPFNYVVTYTKSAGSDSGWAVGGAIVVFNPNAADAPNIDVTDAINDAGASCVVTDGTNATVPGLGSKSFAYTCSYSGAPTSSSETNTATVSWTSETLSDGSVLTANTLFPTAPIDWSATTPVLVDNCASVADSSPDTTVAGPICDSTVFDYSQTRSGVGGTCTDYTNTASFVTDLTLATGSASKTVSVCVGEDLAVSKTASDSFTREYSWSIDKQVDKTQVNIASGGTATFNYSISASETGFTDSGWAVSGTITVTNPNDWEAITADIGDAIDNGGSCSVTGGTNRSIAASGSVTVPYTCTFASNPTSGVNTATATWDGGAAFTPDGSKSGTANYLFGAPTSVVNKTVNISDSYAGALGTLTATDSNPYASHAFTYSRTVSGSPATCTQYDNTATIVETAQTAGKTVTVCVGVDLTVSKTTTPGFTRTYTWNSGEITVTNRNDWEAITADITDLIDNGGVCPVANGTGVTIAKSTTATFNYNCTFSSSPGSGTNSATASWTSGTYFTPDGSKTGTAGYAFGAPTNTVRKTVNVTDTFHGVAISLGILTATDTTPYTSQTITYPRSILVPRSGCLSYPNTATIVGTGSSASTSVQVCGPASTGALTMGFWQNKNGQAIINGGTSTAGVCNSGTWLRQFAPFQDLSSSASCANVAAYFTAAFNAANAGGSTMNPMLKAQMLATALDVYFSDPALGGNRIGAPAPIGGLTIDLTSTVGGTVWYGNVKARQGLAKDAFDGINNQIVFTL